jgi:hypothetical protein
MKRVYRTITAGVALLASSIVLDLAGVALQSIYVLVLSLALGVAGAVVSIRGIIDLFSEVL